MGNVDNILSPQIIVLEEGSQTLGAIHLSSDLPPSVFSSDRRWRSPLSVAVHGCLCSYVVFTLELDVFQTLNVY